MLIAFDRLPYFVKAASNQFWDDHWVKVDLDKKLASYECGNLGYFDTLWRSVLPRKGLILEAGCGQGQYVLGLNRLGYHVIGMDFAEQALQSTKSRYPDINLAVADLTRTPLADGSVSAYISLGVIEHDIIGPEKFLKEANRLLTLNGVAVFTVPYLNIVRRLRYFFSRSKGDKEKQEFYQYYYSKKGLQRYFKDYNFEIIYSERYNVNKTLNEEFSWLNFITRRRSVQKVIRSCRWLIDLAGHNSLYICKKTDFLLDAITSTSPALATLSYTDTKNLVVEPKRFKDVIPSSMDNIEKIIIPCNGIEEVTSAIKWIGRNKVTLGRRQIIFISSGALDLLLGKIDFQSMLSYEFGGQHVLIGEINLSDKLNVVGSSLKLQSVGRSAVHYQTILPCLFDNIDSFIDLLDESLYIRLARILSEYLPAGASVSFHSNYPRIGFSKLLSESKYQLVEDSESCDIIFLDSPSMISSIQAKYLKKPLTVVVHKQCAKTSLGCASTFLKGVKRTMNEIGVKSIWPLIHKKTFRSLIGKKSKTYKYSDKYPQYSLLLRKHPIINSIMTVYR